MTIWTFTDFGGNEWEIATARIDRRPNTYTVSEPGGRIVVKTLRPAVSRLGEVVAPRPCFPVVRGLGPSGPLHGILQGGSLSLDCWLFGARPAPDGMVTYHLIDNVTYEELGGPCGRALEWPSPSLPAPWQVTEFFAERPTVQGERLPAGLFDEQGRLKLKVSEN